MTDTTRTSSAPEIERGRPAPGSTAPAATDELDPTAPAEPDAATDDAPDSRPGGEAESETPG